MLDHYDRWAELKGLLGETVPPRSTISRRALDLSSRPGAAEGMTLQHAYDRFGRMRDLLDRAVREPNYDRAQLVDQWRERFGERLSASDLTPEGLQSKLDWSIAQLEQLGRYREKPEGQREQLERDRQIREYREARAALGATLQQLREARQRSSAIGQR